MIRLSIGRIFNRVFIQKPGVLFTSTQADYNDHCNVLMSHLGIDHETAKIVTDSQDLSKLTLKHLIRNCKICQKYKINVSDPKYMAVCLRLVPETLEHRVLLLEELGVQKLTAIQITRLPYEIKRTVKQFKKLHGIPYDQSIAENIFNSIGGSPRDITLLVKLGNSGTMLEHYKACMIHFKTWNLEFPDAANASYRVIKYPSFRLVRDIMHFLTDELKFEKEFILHHMYLLAIPVEQARQFMTACKDIKIAGMDLPDFVKRYPRILTCDPNNVKELLETFKKYNVTDQSMWSCFHVLRLTNAVFEERMQIILNTPALAVWAKHPRLPYLIFHFKLVQDRIQYLQSLGRLRSANMHAITAVKQFFIRYIRNDKPHVGHKKFIEYVIKNEIGDCDINYLSRHPYWRIVAFQDVRNILLYLKKNYSAEDILKNIHIILYSQSLVDETLQRLYKEYSPETGYHYTPLQYLSLCLYILEKPNHFSGDAVWERKTFEEPDSAIYDILSDPTAEDKDIWSKLQDSKRRYIKTVATSIDH